MSLTTQGLNRLSISAGIAKLGDRLAALWNQRQSGGALSQGSPDTTYSIAAGAYTVDGVVVAGGASANVVLPLTTPDTTGTQYRKLTITIDQAGAYALVIGAVATGSQAAALKSPAPAGTTEVAYIELPVSFTARTTTITAGMLKQAAAPAVALGPMP